jgi:hypothetical protein
MPETYKEGQVESLFDPKTSDDRAIVHVLKAMDEIAQQHRPENHPHTTEFTFTHGALAGVATFLATRGNSTFDPRFVDDVTNQMGAEFLGDDGNGG